jgi:ankyrin repeat protein
VLQVLVVEGKAQINTRDSEGRTALHYAVLKGQTEPAKYLVSVGCSINVQANRGETALDCATMYNSTEVIQFLTSASLLSTTNNYRGFIDLCAPFPSPYFEHRLSLSLRTAFMLCLKATKKTQIGYDVAHSDHRAITLTSRVADHEMGVVRLILSFVGPNQDA